MKRVAASSALVLLFSFATAGWCQTVKAGDVISRPAALPLYGALPSGLYCSDGPIIATLAAGERVKVVSVMKLTCALVLDRSYVEVERIDSHDSTAKRRGYLRLS